MRIKHQRKEESGKGVKAFKVKMNNGIDLTLIECYDGSLQIMKFNKKGDSRLIIHPEVSNVITLR